MVQALPNPLRIGPVHCPGHHVDSAVMGGIVGVQQGQQYMHEMLHPVGHHVVMHHALQGLLEAFHHGTFDVAILTDEEMNEMSLWRKGFIVY